MEGDGANGQQPQPWLRHARSNSSVGSVSSTTHLLGHHSRNPSFASMTALPTAVNPIVNPIANPIVNPIVPCQELIRLTEGSRSQNTSPAPHPLSRQPTFTSTTLSPPPRPPRSATIRESLLDAAFSKDSKSIPPPPPIPDFVDVHLKSPEEGAFPMTAKTPVTAKTPHTAHSAYDNSRFTMYTEHDFEIHRVDSRQTIRPALSAVAQLPSPPRLLRTTQEPIRESLNGPMTANTLISNNSLKDDSLLQEVHERSGTPEESGLSSIAWASLVTHAAVGTSLSSESSLRSPSISSPQEDDEWLPPAPQRRPIADIPMILRPGTPGSAPSETHFRFPPTPSTPGTPSMSRSISLGPSVISSYSSDSIRPPIPQSLTPSRSFGAYRPSTPSP